MTNPPIIWAEKYIMDIILSILLSIKYRLFIIKSDSMLPILNREDLIVTKKLDEYKLGDVVTFSEGNNTKITHRIINVQTIEGIRSYETKGDSNEYGDSNNILSEEIEGKVVFISTMLGRTVVFLVSKWGIGLLLFLPTGIVTGRFIRTLKESFT